MSCDHKCHSEETRLNPGVKSCPICGCENFYYDPNAVPERVSVFGRPSIATLLAMGEEIFPDKPQRDRRLDTYHSLEVFPPDYLARNQHEPERSAKVVTQAHERRLARNARRLKHAEVSGQRRPVFKVKLKEAVTDGEV